MLSQRGAKFAPKLGRLVFALPMIHAVGGRDAASSATLAKRKRTGTIEAIFSVHNANSKLSSNPREVKRAAKAARLRVSPALSHCHGPTLAHQCSPLCSATGAQGGEGSCQEAAGSPRRPGESPRPGAAESGGQG